MQFDCITTLAKNPEPNSVEWGTTQIITDGHVSSIVDGHPLREISKTIIENVKGDVLRLTIFEDGVESVIIDVDKEKFIAGLNKL